VEVCTPASGSVFVIGDTTVSCVAKDATGDLATALVADAARIKAVIGC
jgi:hypothetical protein